ncbi:hypothetical protein [Bradyrhizobium shewense]|uniref:hypothetical protein n=1 Tax=Bradyrhizobium shewense TaxID=1761772 RepID=UPI00101AE1AB|nr:hypothetical protein [Bradyrhizobium shewense]
MKNSRRIVRERLGRRGPNRPRPITEERELITRKEAAAILGCHVDTVKKLENHRGGPLEVKRLHPAARSVYYRLADVMTIAAPRSPANARAQ